MPVSARPAPIQYKRQIVGEPVGPEIDNSNLPYQAVGPVGASGNVYGSSSLLGNAGDSSTATNVGPDVPVNTKPVSQQVGDYELVPGQDQEADLGLYLDLSNEPNPQAIRGQNGGTDPGPRNEAIQRQNPDLLARPGTDSGDIANAKWPMGLSSARSGTGKNSGWARQQNTDELPIATAMAGIDMRLSPNAYRELHWHSANEWSFFPAGVPHSIQAGPDGVEFLLVFNQGDFSEDATDLVTELFLRNPMQILAKNFQTDVSTFSDLPKDQRYIFNGSPIEGTTEEARASVNGPAGSLPADQSYSYHLSAQEPYTVPGGSGFSPSSPVQCVRYTHWHLTSDEWNFFLAGQGRVTIFSGPDASRTFDYQAGDVGYIPVVSSHYVENTGSEPLVYMEVLQSPRYTDISAAQWLGLTPSKVVRETLNLPQSFVDALPKTKQYIVPGNTSHTATNFTRPSYPNAALNSSDSS
ncbi:hypothetical protein LTR97_004792 [Elasticomyces elasticus]|uniref:Cupin type-1 domain-containing protein n=1 Tax=Elasticomyces elasticus TaxID=574655 RepID=A0AAN7WDU4_9PEZI|nr:hypothetical protein LTR97_004792 [Elasticomyces elasticus]